VSQHHRLFWALRQREATPSPSSRNAEQSQGQWHTPAISVFRRLTQEDYKFKPSLSYTVRPCFKKKKERKEEKKKKRKLAGLGDACLQSQLLGKWRQEDCDGKGSW
jgi:hypothetical protein